MADAKSHYLDLISAYKAKQGKRWKPGTAFEIFMVSNVAQLMGFAKPYVGSLTAQSVDPFLEHALTLASHRFEPKKMREGSILTWWDECLRAVALSQRSWKVRTFDGWRWVPGWELGREV